MKLRPMPFALLALATCAWTSSLVPQPANASREQAPKAASPANSALPNAHDDGSAGVESASGKKTILAPLAPERAPAATAHESVARAQDLERAFATHYLFQNGRRAYLQVDKPLYKPGETIWFKTWDLKTRALDAAGVDETTVELISPKGASVMKKRLRIVAGSASNDFALPDEAQGGEYTLRATAADGEKSERTIIVSGYEAPRMKKKLEFVKKAYGAGDTVSATLELKRPTGEVLGNKTLSAVVTIDGVELPRVKTATNAEGAALIKFDLPKAIENGDGLLTILVEDGGITESISKAIPIIQKKLSLAFFPEGGNMVAGLPGRLYFEAKTLLGKPADVEGRLVDDLGHAVVKFATYKNGLGRIDFTPASGRSYHAEISRPSTITEKYALPLAEDKGCVLKSFDDFDGQEPALRVSVHCSEKQKVVVAASVRDNLFDVAATVAASDKPGIIYLRSKNPALANAAGAARVTVFDQQLNPLAERLVFRNRRARLQVQVEPDQKSYAPRGQVALALTTRDAAGKPVAAELALSVVDDTVLSFADDKSGHLLSKLLLESELPGKIEEPNFYLDLGEAQSALALDLLMGTHGYRRFDWVPVLQPEAMLKVASGALRANNRPMPLMAPVMAPPPAPAAEAKPQDGARRREAEFVLKGAAEPRKQMQDAKAGVLQQPKPVMKEEVAVAGNRLAKRLDEARMEKPRLPMQVAAGAPRQMADDGAVAGNIAEDKDFARAARKMKRAAMPEQMEFAPVRVFPLPAYNPGYAGARDDYRDTVFWAPSVKTGVDGKASVKFPLSDAVTSFRVVSEGVGGGAAGRDETVFKSALPFSLSAKLPLEVSSGDKPLIPVTLTNDSNQSLDLSLDASFGSLMHQIGGNNALKAATLAPGQRKSLFIPLEVLEAHGQSQVRLQAGSGGLKDEVLRAIPVAASGFPQLIEKSGQIKGEVSHEINLASALPGSVQGTIKIYPSPLSTMISGLDGMLREPGGCFEQTSSTNYPNVMIMQYLKQHEVADPALQEKSGRLLESGYRKLTGFESKNKGYEWFGGDPGHEALTAYGLLEFIDMKDLSNNVDPAMLARTANWLKARRDGKGGYLRDAKALDSFGRASAEVTDAYITWALVTAGESGLDKEVAQSARLAQSTGDAYQLALATGTLLHGKGAPSAAAMAAANKLAAMQDDAGAWTKADHSITRSGGLNLQIETTSLAVLALLQSGQHLEQARKGVAWLQNHRGGFGQWGATQATVLALKAVIAYDNATRVAPVAGSVTLLIDGVKVAEQAYEAGRREPIIFSDFEAQLAGKNASGHRITLRAKNGSALPYSLAIEYRSAAPASSQAAVIDLQAKLARAELKMGETVRLLATISNKTQTGQPMTLARLGLPGGLGFQNWQLKELREKGQIAFFETRPREVILYLRDMKPGEVKTLALDLVANVPGSYTGPASSSYLYYNDTDKSWAAPLKIRISP